MHATDAQLLWIYILATYIHVYIYICTEVYVHIILCADTYEEVDTFVNLR